MADWSGDVSSPTSCCAKSVVGMVPDQNVSIYLKEKRELPLGRMDNIAY